LPRALDSVLSQALPAELEEIQVVVVDDGSSDGTAAIIEHQYPQVEYAYQQNQGVSAARNTGLDIANGEWIALLDSDDEWLPAKLIQQFDRLKETQALVCHTEEIWIRNGVRVNQMAKHQKRGGWIFEHCLPLCAMSPSSIVIHKSVFEYVGVFDANLPACEDYDLWLRIAAVYPVSYVSEPCINKYGGHQDQLSRQYWGMDRFRVIALEKILASNLSNEMQTAAYEMLQAKLKILLTGAVKHDNQALIEECRAAQQRALAIIHS